MRVARTLAWIRRAGEEATPGDAGCDDYLTKPVNKQQLIATAAKSAAVTQVRKAA